MFSHYLKGKLSIPSGFSCLSAHGNWFRYNGNCYSGKAEPVIPVWWKSVFRYAYCIVLILNKWRRRSLRHLVCCSSKSSFLFCMWISMSFCILMKYSSETPNNFASRREQLCFNSKIDRLNVVLLPQVQGETMSWKGVLEPSFNLIVFLAPLRISEKLKMLMKHTISCLSKNLR